MTTPAGGEANPDFDGKHPRGPGGHFASKNGGQQQGALPLSPDVVADVKAFQKAEGLPQTGRFDPATMHALHRASKASAGGKSGRSGAAKKLLAARTAAKKAARVKAETARKQARAKAHAQQVQARSLAAAVNKLPVGARARYRANAGVAPAGYQWNGSDQLIPAPNAVTVAAEKSGAAQIKSTLAGGPQATAKSPA